MIDRIEVLEKAKEFYKENNKEKVFEPGKTYIPESGKIIDEEDLSNLIDASLDMWLTSGRY